MNEHYEIQSGIDPKFGAVIYPFSTYKGGAGWYLREISTGKAYSPEELRAIAGNDVVEELTKDARELYAREDNDE